MFFFFYFFIFLLSIGFYYGGSIWKQQGEFHNQNRIYTEGIITGNRRHGNITVRFPDDGNLKNKCRTRNFDIKKYPLGSVVKLSYSYYTLWGIKALILNIEEEELKVTPDEVLGARFIIVAKIALIISIILLILGIVFMFI